MHAARSVDDVLAVLRLGADRGEPAEGTDAVSQLAHSLQCAAALAVASPDDLELQAAGLLHDIGHSLAPGDVEGHGRHGRAYVEPLLGERVGALVELHVPAKRWLVAVDPGYRELLSAGSVRTLLAQGEAMSVSERQAFESEPHHTDAVTLRRADEAAKVVGAAVEPLERWAPVLEAVAARYATG
jgi:predicted HD phosphohydrolase